MSRIEEINALGDKILNEWGINNAKNLGLQACTMAIEALIELDRLRAERDARQEDIKHLVFKCADDPLDFCSEVCGNFDGTCVNGAAAGFTDKCHGFDFRGLEAQNGQD